jgi:hypothetical protein
MIINREREKREKGGKALFIILFSVQDMRR